MPFLSPQKSTKRKFRVSEELSVSGVQTPKVHGPNHTSSRLGGVFPPEAFSVSSSFLYRTMTQPQSLHPQRCCCLLLKLTWLCSLLLTPTSSPGLPPAAAETFGLLMVQIYKQCDLLCIQASPLRVFWETKVGNWKRDHKK